MSEAVLVIIGLMGGFGIGFIVGAHMSEKIWRPHADVVAKIWRDHAAWIEQYYQARLDRERSRP